MISNGSSKPLGGGGGGLPNMSNAMRNWFQKITIRKITEEIVNYRVVETETEISFEGVMQPMGSQEVSLKPLGQREWRWFTMHSRTDVELDPDEVVLHKGIRYRVKGKMAYDSYGYYKYDLVEDFNETIV